MPGRKKPIQVRHPEYFPGEGQRFDSVGAFIEIVCKLPPFTAFQPSTVYQMFSLWKNNQTSESPYHHVCKDFEIKDVTDELAGADAASPADIVQNLPETADALTTPSPPSTPPSAPLIRPTHAPTAALRASQAENVEPTQAFDKATADIMLALKTLERERSGANQEKDKQLREQDMRIGELEKQVASLTHDRHEVAATARDLVSVHDDAWLDEDVRVKLDLVKLEEFDLREYEKLHQNSLHSPGTKINIGEMLKSPTKDHAPGKYLSCREYLDFKGLKYTAKQEIALREPLGISLRPNPRFDPDDCRRCVGVVKAVLVWLSCFGYKFDVGITGQEPSARFRSKPREHPKRMGQRMMVMLKLATRDDANKVETILQKFCADPSGKQNNRLRGFSNDETKGGSGHNTDKNDCQYLYIVYWYECERGCRERCCR